VLFRGKQASKQHFVNAAAEALFAVDFDDGDAFVEAIAENWVGVNIDQVWFVAVATKED
jgi:hypothetical protein